MPVRPKSWWWISAGIDNPALRWTSRERTLRWWHLTCTCEFTWTINWTGLITLRQQSREVRADFCWGRSGHLECRRHSWLLSMTLWWHQPFSVDKSAGAAVLHLQRVGRDWIKLESQLHFGMLSWLSAGGEREQGDGPAVIAAHQGVQPPAGH